MWPHPHPRDCAAPEGGGVEEGGGGAGWPVSTAASVRPANYEDLQPVNFTGPEIDTTHQIFLGGTKYFYILLLTRFKDTQSYFASKNICTPCKNICGVSIPVPSGGLVASRNTQKKSL